MFFYPLIVLFCVKFGVPLRGIISVTGSKFFTQEIADAGYLWSVCGYLVFLSTLWGIRNKMIEFRVLKISFQSRLIMLIGHFIFAMVAYPRAFHLSESRFNLLPGGGWASVYSLFSILLILSSKRKFGWIEIIHLCTTLFVLVGGERADSILILLFLLLYRGDEVKKEIKLNFKVLSLMGIGVSFFLFVGAYRTQSVGFILNNFDELFPLIGRLLASSLYNQQTVSDTTHVYLSTVWGYFNDKGNLMTLLNTPFTIFPMTPLGGVPSKYFYQRLIYPYISNAGGGLFYSEGALNFGMIGVSLYAFIWGYIIKRTLVSKKLFGHLAFVVIFILQMRVQWYGLLYMMKPFVLFYMFTLVYDLRARGYFKNQNEI